MTEPIEVNVGACRCPGSPHPADLVFLKPEADVAMVLAFNVTWQTMAGAGLSIDEFNADMQAAMAGVYLRHGIASWNFTDEKGEAVLIRQENITRLLPPRNGGLQVAERANDLYYAELTRPLELAVEQARANRAKSLNRELRRQTRKSSPHGPTGGSTRATNGSGPTPREPSAPSSPASTAGTPRTG
jgi:hypothetical protein